MIAVTGITGHSGKFFLKQLVDNNYPGALRCLVRESSDTSALDASGLNIEKFRGSIDSDADLERFVSGADTVVHIAGIMKTPRLLAAIERAGGVKHVVLVHTTGIYSKYKMASAGYKAVEEDMQQYLDRGMNITIIRPTMIFGDLCDRFAAFGRQAHLLGERQMRGVEGAPHFLRGGQRADQHLAVIELLLDDLH